jgi:DNA-binding CsgD family transcriptional regulator
MNVHDLLSNNTSNKGELTEPVDIDTFIRGVKAYDRLNNATNLLLNFDNHQILYMSPKLLFLENAKPQDKKRDCPNPYWSYIPEELLEYLLQIKRSILHLRHEMSLEEYKTHVCITDYPIMIDGREFYISQKFTPLVVDSKSIIRLGLFTITPSARKHIESSVITDSGKCFLYNPGTRIYERVDYSTLLTATEKRILKSAETRMTNEEIADYQNVSLSAVKANITRILKKLAVKKVHEAVTIANDYRII